MRSDFSILIFCLVFALTVGCTNQTLVNNSTNQELGEIMERPGVTFTSEEQITEMVTGQTIYVPIYSEIYDFNSFNQVFQLTATLSIRNTDLSNSIILKTIDYYNSSGDKINAYLSQPIQLSPLASTEIVIAKDNQFGGAGANFIVEWEADTQVNQPLIEAIMISTASQQGISFVTQGQVIKQK